MVKVEARPIEDEITYLDNIQDNHHIGITWSEIGSSINIVKRLAIMKYDGLYVGLKYDSNQNTEQWGRVTKQEYVDDFKNMGSNNNIMVFKFETEGELIKWMLTV